MAMLVLCLSILSAEAVAGLTIAKQRDEILDKLCSIFCEENAKGMLQ